MRFNNGEQSNLYQHEKKFPWGICTVSYLWTVRFRNVPSNMYIILQLHKVFINKKIVF